MGTSSDIPSASGDAAVAALLARVRAEARSRAEAGESRRGARGLKEALRALLRRVGGRADQPG